MAKKRAPIDVRSKGYIVPRGVYFIAVIHITYEDTLLDVEWTEPFETREACQAFLLSEAANITEKVCNEIGLEVDSMAVTNKNKGLH